VDAPSCSTGFCVNQVCCLTACNGPLQQCNLPGQRGTCASTSASAPTLSRPGLIGGLLLLAGVAALAFRRRRRT
jgi:MYXO-CTERM domain-containing protein